MNRQVRGEDFPKLANLSDCTIARSICQIAYGYLFPVFGVRCSRATPINLTNFITTLCHTATTLLLPQMHPIGCNYRLELSIDPAVSRGTT